MSDVVGITLRLTFAGLIAFAPAGDGSNNIRVLLVGSGEPYYTSDGCPVHSHIPALVYERRNVALPCKDQAGVISPSNGSVCSLLLRNEDMDLTSLQTVQVKPLALDAFASSYLAKVGTAVADAAHIKQGLLEQHPSIQGLVAARVRLPASEVSACHTAEICNEPRNFDFKSVHAGVPSVPVGSQFADVVSVSYKLASTSVELTLKKFGWPGSTRTLTLSGTAGDTVDVLIVNMAHSHCAENVCSQAGVDRHFELFYRLSPTNRPATRLLVPQVAGPGDPLNIVPCTPLVDYASEHCRCADCSNSSSTSNPIECPEEAYSRPICPMALFQ